MKYAVEYNKDIRVPPPAIIFCEFLILSEKKMKEEKPISKNCLTIFFVSLNWKKKAMKLSTRPINCQNTGVKDEAGFVHSANKKPSKKENFG